MGEDTKKPDPRSTTTPSSQEQQQKKEETIQDNPTAPATETAAQKKGDEATPTTPPQQAATTPPTPPDPPNNSQAAVSPPDPPQPPNGDTKQGEGQGKSWVDVIKDSVTILGGSTVVIAALFVLVGRVYIEGYFNVLNIPYISVDFPIGDYGGLGFLSTSAVFLLFICPVLIFLGLFTICYLVFKLVQHNIKRWARGRKNKSPHGKIAKTLSYLYSVRFLYVPWSIFILLVSLIFIVVSIILSNALDLGKKSGYQHIQESAIGVILKSKEPFLISAPTVTAATATANDEPTYTYEGLYLLTDNDGTYFLFDDVDETCSPTNVYIVRETQLLSVEFISETFSKSCTPPTDTSPTPTVTPTNFPTTTPTPQATPTPMP